MKTRTHDIQYNEQLLCEAIHEGFATLRTAEQQLDRSQLAKLGPLNKLLDQFVLLPKLRLYCRYLSYSAFMHTSRLDVTEADFSWLTYWLKSEPPLLFSVPAIHLYALLSKLLHPDNQPLNPVQEVQRVLAFVETHADAIDRQDRVDVLSMLSNYCIREANTGTAALYPLLFRVNVRMVDLKYGKKMKRGDTLPASIFKNTVMTALSGIAVNWKDLSIHGVEADTAFDWVNAFITFYGKRLRAEDASVYIGYCTARNLFQASQYKAAYLRIQKIQDPGKDFIALNIKLLKVLCMYELAFEGTPSNMKLLQQSKDRIPSLLEAYRKQLDYLAYEKPTYAYQIGLHQEFIHAFKQLYGLFQKGYHNSNNVRQLRLLDEMRKRQIQALEGVTYPFVAWVKEKLRFQKE